MLIEGDFVNVYRDVWIEGENEEGEAEYRVLRYPIASFAPLKAGLLANLPARQGGPGFNRLPREHDDREAVARAVENAQHLVAMLREVDGDHQDLPGWEEYAGRNPHPMAPRWIAPYQSIHSIDYRIRHEHGFPTYTDETI